MKDIFPMNSMESQRLLHAANAMSDLSEKKGSGYRFVVGDTYLNCGAGEQWTTILAKKGDERGYQALYPKAWTRITRANCEDDVREAAREIWEDLPDELK